MVVEAIGSIVRRLKSLWDEDIAWLLGDMGYTVEEVVKQGPEAADVIIRCAMLGHVYGDVEDYIEERFS